MSSAHASKSVIFAALAGNLGIALTKTLAAVFTGSAAMFSEAVHSFADTGNQMLLLLGMRQAAKPADEDHPFGYGLRLYFWTFVVAMLIFGVGATVALYEGVDKILHPHPAEHVWVNYLVLGASVLFEGLVWIKALQAFRHEKGDRGWMDAIRRSKDPTVFTVLFEDSAALAGLVVALIGVALSQTLQMPWIDGAASVVIGLMLAATAFLLAYESMSLLTGEGVPRPVRQSIRQLVQNQPEVLRLNELLTMHFSPQDVLVTVSVDFRDDLASGQLEQVVSRLDARIKALHPEVRRVFIEAQSFEGHQRQLAADDARLNLEAETVQSA